jgi:FtsH-binding integral membrane protein
MSNNNVQDYDYQYPGVQADISSNQPLNQQQGYPEQPQQPYTQPAPQQYAPAYTQPAPQQYAPESQPMQDYAAYDRVDGPIDSPINNDFAQLAEEAEEYFNPQELNKNTRLGFVRKVFGIVAFQLAFTAFVISLPMYSYTVQDYIRSNDAIWTFVVAFIVMITIMYSLFCYRSVARAVPTNYILLGIFTLAEAWTVSFICSFYSPLDVFIAAAATAAVVVGLFMYALVAKVDFTYWLGAMFGILVAWMILAIFGLYWHNKWTIILWAGLGVIIFSIYIVIDLWLILGKGRGGFSIDDYIVAAMMLYIDIMRLFLEILKIVGASRR